MNKIVKRALLVIAALVVAAAIGIGVYLSNYYHADQNAASYLTSKSHVTVQTQAKTIIFQPENYDTGFIFYPGGKVQFEAYAPILQKLAQEKHVLCILVHMPGNLAVLNANAADGIQEQYPKVAKWYIGGHSLGGAMAASYVAKHSEEYEGLVLFGAYPTKDLSGTKLKLLSLYGSEDGVLNRESYEENRKNWPKNSREHVIKGGNHAGFGSYGVQKGDGKATISANRQWAETVEEVGEWLTD